MLKLIGIFREVWLIWTYAKILKYGDSHTHDNRWTFWYKLNIRLSTWSYRLNNGPGFRSTPYIYQNAHNLTMYGFNINSDISCRL